MEQSSNKLSEIPIGDLPSTSSITLRKLKSVGISNFWDLLNYFPFRYENYSLISPINKVQNGEVVTIKGKIQKFVNIFTKKGLRIQKATISDDSGKIDAVWFNQFYLSRILQPGLTVSLSGEVKGFFHEVTFEPREYEIIGDLKSPTVHTGRLVPIYPEKKGLSSKLLREKIFNLINHIGTDRYQYGINEIFASEIVSFNALLSEAEAYKEIHFPKNAELAKKARERLAFDELFTIQLSAKLIRLDWEKEKVGNLFKADSAMLTPLNDFIKHLPFRLTNAQKKVIDEIVKDLKSAKPMNRFLEGDVGSGKTVVAAIACYLAYLNGFQSLFMAPTEILAMQHYQTLTKLFKSYSLKIGLQTRSKKQITILDRSTQDGKKASDFNIIVGTQALLNQKLKFDRLGFVVVDEQHRFGVAQRAELKKKGVNPHLLTMTATPIPRTVALTLYGELDLSVIDEMPKGRLPVKTFLVPKVKRESGYLWIKKKIRDERIQVFIICPLIEESEIETMKSVRAAKKEFDRLQKEIFPEFRLGMLHGKIKAKEKEAVMRDFKAGKSHILVATPVVEVGIDVANATIMLIEGAERFGLAQLHQLRGRVGRGSIQSYCFLYTESTDEKVRERLTFFARSTSGMQVAEHDLKLRGPGQIFGTQQHGYLDLKVASLSDYDLIDKSKRAVNYFLNKYKVDKFSEIKKRLEEYRIMQVSRD